MTSQFQLNIPSTTGDLIALKLGAGDVLYMLGANGTGKSSLVARLFNQHQANAKRISAHRQTWFESNTLDMTSRVRQELENNVRAQDAQPHARYREWNPMGRATMAIYDLLAADTMQARKITKLVRADDAAGARAAAQEPSPIQVINELMQLSNLPIAISIEDGDKIVARNNGGSGYSVAELSDGERNAFLIAAEVLTAKADTLILIDEPERHLHRSIISPLLRLLFERRSDCVFIISTHELMLPVDTPGASTLLVRGCKYEGQTVRAWSADVLAPGVVIDDALKADILGSRQKMVFVEGTAQSLDGPLYSLLLPQVSVIPKANCRDVEHAVRGLRGASEMHWLSAWGIIDNDQRSDDDVARLRAAGVWALSHYSVESLYYHPKMIARIAERQSSVIGGDAETLADTATAKALAAAKNQRDHLVGGAVLRASRAKVLEGMPKRGDTAGMTAIKIEVDVVSLRLEEERRFDALIAAADWDGLLTRYPLRESQAFDWMIEGLEMKDRANYRSAVRKLLQEDEAAVKELRELLGGLYADVTV